MAQTLWIIDGRAVRHFPEINLLNSTSLHSKGLRSYYNSMDPEYIPLREHIRGVLFEEDEMMEVVKKIGKVLPLI
jgi:vacuolar-type H+-ATPase catalytic subunit A/Vma1